MSDSLSKISEFARFGSRLGLERMTALMNKLGNPQDELRVIHVAGTNGKGSSCRFIYEILQGQGYKVGLYSSPFLEVFNERIEFNGQLISNDDLDKYTKAVLSKVDELVREGKDSPTEFELITAIAFLYFRDKRADFAILEVGLGGRGDSTNLVKNPLITGITSISMDHMDRLGDSLDKIACEKAGIIKEDVPVVSSVRAQEAYQVIESVALAKHANFIPTKDCSINIKSMDKDGSVFDMESWKDLHISMVGEHQIENAVFAITVVQEMVARGYVEKLDEDKLRLALNRANNHGRFEKICDEPLILLDGAHNEDGTKALVKTMTMAYPSKKVLLITGMLKDKDTQAITDNLSQISKSWVITEPDSDRKLSVKELSHIAQEKGVDVRFASENYEEALEFAREHSHEYDMILVTGSLYLIGLVRTYVRRYFCD
ncbi:MAG: bifunctional folylpolyglutamate synthase/dihydrofolate synthase [Clostridia bacterium]|nr:bifunctional folylpolyglutamate synthase/dihydrofolate synthase [Clostridia bacterium]